jgi:hypothetical protein
MTGNLTSSCPPLSRWYAVNVTGVAGALFATLPLPLAGNIVGHEEDNGESNNDNDDSNENSNDNNDNEKDNYNSGDGDGNSDGGGKYFFGGDSFLINKF